jgi:hypothetical protein
MSEPTTSTLATLVQSPPVQPEQVAPGAWALSRRDPVVDSIVRAALDPVAPILDVLTPGGGE